MNNLQNRILFLDSLRGYALFGLFLVHCVEMFEIVWLAPPFGNPAFDWTFLIFGGKAYAIFALLFGVSFYLMLSRRQSRGEDFRLWFLWRITILFFFGLLHGLLYSGDILQILALTGVLLLFLHRLPIWLIASIGIVFLFQIPFLLTGWFWECLGQSPYDAELASVRNQVVLTTYQNGSFGEVLYINLWQGFVRKWSWLFHYGRLYNIVGLTLLGYVMGRNNFFTRRTSGIDVLCIGLLTGSIFFVLVLEYSRTTLVELWQWSYAGYYLPDAVGMLVNNFYTFITILVGMILFRLPGLHQILLTLIPAGRLSLTVYLSQSILCIPLYYGFGFNKWQMDSTTNLIVGCVLWILIMLCTWLWTRKFRYGPAEWFWRACTLRNFRLSWYGS